uniref:Zinc finger protein 585B n=1 Tax=Cacopsylla melanoneura TaxID=428564 RepID=A0A8D8V7Q0_9HEMI
MKAYSFVCYYCGQLLVDKTFIELHIKIDHGHILHENSQLEWYTCKLCSKLYTAIKYIQRHMRNVHSIHASTLADEYKIKSFQDISFLCKDCSKPCLFSATCPDHSVELVIPSEDCHCDAEAEAHQCQVCSCQFSNCSALWSHMFGIHRKHSKFHCNLCIKRKIKFPSDVVLHMRQKHGKLLSMEQISTHKVQNNKTRIYIDGVLKHRCSHCKEIFDETSEFKRHLAEAHQNVRDRSMSKTYACRRCGATFNMKKLLRVHSNEVHNSVVNYECDTCARQFSYKSQLSRHLVSHSQERASVCELCGAAFTQPAGLYNHKFTHDATRYACTGCDKSYAHPSLLRLHMKTHTDTSTYVCEVCGKDFRTVRNLKRHKLTHNPHKSFVCSVCNTGFTVKKYLLQHYKTHTKEKR